MQISETKKGLLNYINPNWVFKSFRKMNFKAKLVFSFIFVSIIPILLVQSISYYNITAAMKENVDELTKLNLAQTDKNLNTTLNSYMDILYQIYTDDDIIELINKINQESENALETSILRDKLSQLTNSKMGIRSIAFLCSSGKTVFYDTLTASSIESSWMTKNFNRTEFYSDITKSKGAVLVPTSYASKLGDKKYYLFHIANKMVDFNNIKKGPIGVIVISIDEDIIFKACNETENVNQNPKSIKSLNFIVDKDGSIVSFPDKEYIGRKLSDYGVTGQTANGDKYNTLFKSVQAYKESKLVTNELKDEDTGWIIVNAVDQTILFNKVYMAQRLTILFGVLALLFSIAVIITVSKNFSGSINKILSAMKTAQKGELSVQVQLDDGDDDEISAIAARFNKMIFRINQLMEEVKDATFKQKEAEIRALEAQINPHFLYNTLDAINWMAIEKEEHEISNMLKSLAQILRYSINKSNSIVKLREEIEWLKKYIYLQQIRFNHSFECMMDVGDSVLDCNIHKLLFQPFIENVIIHGFEGLKSGGILKISIQDMDNTICIRIEDNGKGIDKEIAEALNSLEEKGIETSGSGLGVKNVFHRMKMYYGENGSWNIKSAPGAGTIICLKIPKL